jgi:hypothetical protein
MATAPLRFLVRRPIPLLALLLALGPGLAAGAALAEPDAPSQIGDRLDGFALPDQFDTEHQLDASVRIVLFGRDMDGGNLLKAALDEEGVSLLEAMHAIYVADIHRMPSLIARMFALPSMRKRPYPVWIDKEGEVTARLPSEPGKATILGLRELRITSIEFADTPEAVRAGVERAASD